MKNADIYPSIQNLIIFFICSVVGMRLNGLKKNSYGGTNSAFDGKKCVGALRWTLKALAGWTEARELGSLSVALEWRKLVWKQRAKSKYVEF